MEITYDTEADAIYIKLAEAEFVRNKEVAEGVILDLGEGDTLLGIEILEASTRFPPQELGRVDIRMPLNLAAVGRGRERATGR